MPLKSGNISGNFEAHLSSRVIWVLYRLDHLILSLLLNKRDERERHNAPSRPVDVKLLSEQCPVMPDSRFYCYSLLTSLNFIKPCYLEPPSSSQTFLHKHHHLHYHYHHHYQTLYYSQQKCDFRYQIYRCLSNSSKSLHEIVYH